MTPNCVLLDNQSENFLVQILIYKNKMVKWIIREGEERDKEETQDCQRSIPSILDPRHPEQPLDFTKIQSPFLSWYSFFFLLRKQTLFACYLLSHKHVSINTIFVICKQRVFFILWVGRQTNQLCYQTNRRRSGWIVSTPLRGSFKHSVGTEGFDKTNSWKQMW